MNCKDLNNEMLEVIRKCCSTEQDKEDAEEYFGSTTVSEMVDEALED